MGVVLRVLGWLVIVGGSSVSAGVFWIDHMNPDLWVATGIGVAASVGFGGLLLWLGRQRDRQVTTDRAQRGAP
jgi:hypothetical protein